MKQFFEQKKMSKIKNAVIPYSSMFQSSMVHTSNSGHFQIVAASCLPRSDTRKENKGGRGKNGHGNAVQNFLTQICSKELPSYLKNLKNTSQKFLFAFKATS